MAALSSETQGCCVNYVAFGITAAVIIALVFDQIAGAIKL